MPLNFTLQLDSVPYSTKPKGRGIGALKIRLSEQPPTAFALEDFAEKVTQGYSFTPAVLMGGSKAENWQYQQVFGIDIDNEDKTVKGSHDKTRAAEPLTVEQVLIRCNEWGIKPALIYETFSSTPEWQKFRVVFISETAVTEKQRAANILKSFMAIFPECDPACKNLDRLFFGGKNILHIDNTAVLTAENIISLERTGAAVLKPPVRTSGKRDNQLEELIQNYDFLGYIRKFFPGTERRSGKGIQINPCPICGHNDDFWYCENEKSFYCFGANGSVGGSIIDFVMHTQKVDYKEAVKYFKYVLCGLDEKRNKADFRGNKMIERYNTATSADKQVSELPPYIYEDCDRSGGIVYKVSAPLLADFIRTNRYYFFINDNFGSKNILKYWYHNGVYDLVSENEIKGYIKRLITDFDLTLLKMSIVDEVYKDITTDRNFVTYDRLNADENIINFKNGLLYLDTMELKEHTPSVLSTIQIPCCWNPFAPSSPVFDRYINMLASGSGEIKTLLLQFMGVALSNVHGYRMKQSLFMVGKGNSGKSQLRLLCDRLLGKNNVSSESLETYDKPFGTMSLIGKRLVGSPDMPYMTAKNMDMFKVITGGDDIPVQMKHGGFHTIRFNGVMWNCGNELPKFGGDKGPHVYERFVIVRCDNVIPKKQQDKQLLDKMYAERESIVVLAVNALKQVISNGYNYDIPECCIQNNIEYRKENNPVRMFYDECCCDRPHSGYDNCTCSRMYDVFKAWCRDNNNGHCLSVKDFRKELASYLEIDDIKECEKILHGIRYYTFTLTIEAKQAFKQAYGYASVQNQKE